LRVLEDCINLFSWFTIPVDATTTDFGITLGDFFGAIDFRGMKMEKPEDVAWYKAFRAGHNDLYKFIKDNAPGITAWKGHSKPEDYYKEVLAGTAVAPVIVASAPEPAPVVKAPVVAAAPVKKAAPKKKLPSKVEKPGNIMEYSDYRKETITLTADEVDNSSKFKFYDCFGCKIVIEGKICSVEMIKCKKCDLSVDETMNFVDLLKCDETKLRIKTKVKTVQIEGCSEVQAFVTEAARHEV